MIISYLGSHSKLNFLVLFFTDFNKHSTGCLLLVDIRCVGWFVVIRVLVVELIASKYSVTIMLTIFSMRWRRRQRNVHKLTYVRQWKIVYRSLCTPAKQANTPAVIHKNLRRCWVHYYLQVFRCIPNSPTTVSAEKTILRCETWW